MVVKDPRTCEIQVAPLNQVRVDNDIHWWEWVLMIIIFLATLFIVGVLLLTIFIWFIELLINCIGWLIHFFNS